MSIMEATIGWIAPPQCISCGFEGLAFCKECSDSLITPFGERCWRCNSLSPKSRTCVHCRHTGSPASVWISTNHDGPARDLLSAYKFGHQRVAAEPIARMMVKNIIESNSPQEIRSKNYLVLPVPTATSRVRERGFGHSELLARNIATKLRAERYNALRRLDQTRQLGARREDRLKQLSSSFVIKNPQKITGRNILLIDDVVTTGGTLIWATTVLRAAGAKQVYALLFAKRL